MWVRVQSYVHHHAAKATLPRRRWSAHGYASATLRQPTCTTPTRPGVQNSVARTERDGSLRSPHPNDAHSLRNAAVTHCASHAAE